MCANGPYLYTYIYIYICAAYISPQTSSSNSGISLHDKFEGLRKELDWYTTIGDVAIIGDLNSRVGSIQERHIGFNMDPNAVEITSVDYAPPRRSFDKNVNAYGRKLLQILTDYDLMIINGRVWGDLTGRYTARETGALFLTCCLCKMISSES